MATAHSSAFRMEVKTTMNPSPSALTLPPLVCGDAAAHHRFVGAQDPMGRDVTPFGTQVRRAFDVAEEDGHRTAGELGHRPLPHQAAPSWLTSSPPGSDTASSSEASLRRIRGAPHGRLVLEWDQRRSEPLGRGVTVRLRVAESDFVAVRWPRVAATSVVFSWSIGRSGALNATQDRSVNRP